MNSMTPTLTVTAASAATRGPHEYRDDVKRIRAVAAFKVVVDHAFPTLLTGLIDVDVLFVIGEHFPRWLQVSGSE